MSADNRDRRVCKCQQERYAVTDAKPYGEAVEVAWRQYCIARAQAEATNAIDDGIAAGRAWRNFLLLFEALDQHDGRPA